MKIREKLSELLVSFEERRQARREARMMDKAGATADTTAAYYGASSRCVSLKRLMSLEIRTIYWTPNWSLFWHHNLNLHQALNHHFQASHTEV